MPIIVPMPPPGTSRSRHVTPLTFATRRHSPLIALGTVVAGLAIVFLQEVARGLGWL